MPDDLGPGRHRVDFAGGDLSARTTGKPGAGSNVVYAMRNPEDSSTELVVRTAQLSPDGSVVPTSIDTGSAGLAGALQVKPFGQTALSPR